MSKSENLTGQYVIAGLIFIILAFLGCKLGSTPVSFKEVLDVFLEKIGLMQSTPEAEQAAVIVWKLRVPRIILAFVVGGGLAICGVAMQALTQNVLAEPYILGVASGASFAVVLANLLFFSNAVLLSAVIPGFAFAGAVVATYLVYQVGGVGSNNKLILAGMAISIIFNALSNLLIHFLPSNSSLKNVTMWMWGSLAGARWDNILVPSIVSITGVIIFTCLGTSFNLMSIGNETATTLGINVKRMRMYVMLITSVLTGVLISASGLIGFIGFIVPHVIRMTKGSDHKKLFKLAFLGGGIFLLCMDILARTILAPREIAVGIFSALCGGPFFIWLLYRNTKGMRS